MRSSREGCASRPQAFLSCDGLPRLLEGVDAGRRRLREGGEAGPAVGALPPEVPGSNSFETSHAPAFPSKASHRVADGRSLRRVSRGAQADGAGTSLVGVRPACVTSLRTEVAAAVVRLSAALEGALLSMAASKDLDELERADGSALRRRRW